MKIAVTKTRSKRRSDFDRSEWRSVNIDNFGKENDWSTKRFFFTAYHTDGTIIGLLDLKIKAHVGYVESLIIAKQIRDNGFGNTLLSEAEKICQQNDAHKIYLHTGKT